MAFEEVHYKETTVINRELVPEDLQNVVPLFDTTLSPKEQTYLDAGYDVKINRYLKAFKATINIKSIAELEIPTFNELATNLEINTKLRNLEWESKRKHLNLVLQTDGLNWKKKGTVSLINRGDLPYYESDLMAFFTEGLAIELGDVAKIGAQVQDVGYGWITSQDYVLIYANLVKEVTIIKTTDNIERIDALNLKDFGLSLLEQDSAAQVRALLGISIPIVLASRTTDLSLTNATATDIVYLTEILDTFNCWDGTTFTCPSNGVYTFNFNAHCQSTAGTVTAGDHQLYVSVNGTSYTITRNTGSSTNVNHYISGIFTISLNSGDVVKTRININFTGSTTTKMAAGTTPTTLKIVKDK